MLVFITEHVAGANITEHVAVGIYYLTCSCWYLLLNM